MKFSFFSMLAIGIFSYCSYAQLENGGFEANLDGWHPSGYYPEAVSSFTADNHEPVTINPVDGSKFALLKSGGQTAAYNYSEIWRDITVTGGSSIKGFFFFATDDYLNWNDVGTVKLVPYDNSMDEILLAESSVAVVGDYGSMDGWQRFEHTFSNEQSGNYKLIASVSDKYDYQLPSYLAIDAVTLTPEPASMLLLGLGAVVLRRHRRK